MYNKMISVVIPVYNIEKYISKCLDSILSQTYTNLEIITVDDGSTDNSGKILDEYAVRDSRIRVIHKSNGGVSSARNTGLDNATGDFIGFIDGDDTAEADMYELLVSLLVENSCDISHIGHKLVYDDGRVVLCQGSGEKKLQDTSMGLNDLLSGKKVEPGCCTKLYRASLFQGIRFNENIHINEDLLINYLLFQKSQQSIFYDVCKYNYCKRSGSASTASLDTRHIFDPIEVKSIILNNSRKNDEPEAYEAYIKTIINSYNNILLSGGFIEEKGRVRNILRQAIVKEKPKEKKTRYMSSLIVTAPCIYKRIYLLLRK